MGIKVLSSELEKYFSTDFDEVRTIFNAHTIRDRSRIIYDYVAGGSSPFFILNGNKLNDTASYVVETIKQNYPSLDVAYHSRWRHFQIDGIDQSKAIFESFQDPVERLRASIEITIVSVLMDAGAGDQWSYRDIITGKNLSRSEGLAIASLRMYQSGVFSDQPQTPWRVDLKALKRMDQHKIMRYLQVSQSNPLVGVLGRAQLLQKLGDAMSSLPQVFERKGCLRLGNLADFLVSLADDGQVSLHDVFKVILYAFSKIWQGEHVHGPFNLGDTWRHPVLDDQAMMQGLVPFHKLSQWLTYSMIEPLENFGFKITDVNLLTGLPEYRNGGLFIDLGVLQWKDEKFACSSYEPSSQAIVEWRALTVVLLDLLAVEVRRILQLSCDEFPLVKVLEGGSWAAGRRIAKHLRPATGESPIKLLSDATVF